MITAIVQARLSSTRLPGKVLLPLLGKPMLEWQLGRLARSKKLQQIVLAIPEDPSEQELVEFAKARGYLFHRGDLNDVLDRFYQTAKAVKASTIVRITGDCPLIDPALIDQLLAQYETQKNDYTSNTLKPTYPDGLDAEVFSFAALEKAWKEAKAASEREHVTPYFYKNPEMFSLGSLENKKDLSALRLTVDTPSDMQRMERAFQFFKADIEHKGWEELCAAIESGKISWDGDMEERNLGYMKSLEQDALKARYEKSLKQLDRALAVIPLGSQTFSKSITQYPKGISPFYIEKGKGSQVWDVDGNAYIDFICSLCSINLGYCDPDVDKAVREQLEKGVIFSLPSPLESEVAEQIVDMVPCAEKVRFGKNGSDATAGAVRLARAITKRDHVAVCGYHGWQDWYIGSTTRNMGVPEDVQKLTHKFDYGKIDSLHKLFQTHKDQIACVIMEPANVTMPEKGFLAECQELAKKNGALFVLDETITGFRYAKGGAQELFGVTPDLATFGKGIANGYPLSALAGKAEYMRLLEEIFFSFTFGGECLSLAAAKATLQKVKTQPVIGTMQTRGTQLMENVSRMIKDLDIGHLLGVSGHSTWSFLLFKDSNGYNVNQIKTYFMQEIFRAGILTLGTHNLCYAHSEENIQTLDKVYRKVFASLAELVKEKKLESHLLAKPLEPLFKVR